MPSILFRKRVAKWAAALLGASVALAVVTASGAVAGGPDAGLRRQAISLRVSLTAGGPADQTLAAVLYQPARGKARGIQVLVPGATYDHRYFDLRTRRGFVSQARQAAADGWIAVAVDPLGRGRSSRPAANLLTGTSQATALHQLVGHLKARHRNLPVALVGHSLGSTVAIQEAATFRDVDAVVLTGFLHHAGAAGAMFGVLIHPAADDPAFTRSPAPAGYLTTRPGLRHLFYWPFNADLSTVEADDAAKQTTTQGEMADFVAEQSNDGYAGQVTVPVLALIGEHDLSFFDPKSLPGAVAAESRAYPASPGVDVHVIADAGHDLALQRNATTTARLIDSWLGGQVSQA